MLSTLYNRRRIISGKYTNADFVLGYDVDRDDLCYLMRNLDNLSAEENKRFGYHLIAICGIVLNSPKFVHNPIEIKEELESRMLEYMLEYAHKFDFDKISKRTGKTSHPFSYLFRIAYTQGSTWFNLEYKRRKMLEKLKNANTERMGTGKVPKH